MLEYIGYLASVIVLVSLLMSSVKKLRWINLFGSITFVVYGFLIKAYPIAVLNIFTITINIYYLIKMSNAKTYFKILEIDKQSKYLEHFLFLHKNDLNNNFNISQVNVDEADISFYILRDIVPAGVFVGSKIDQNTLRIDLDYVSPPYRDFLIGKFLYTKHKEIFLNKGIKKLITYTNNPKHINYLKKMNFIQSKNLDKDNLQCFEIQL